MPRAGTSHTITRAIPATSQAGVQRLRNTQSTSPPASDQIIHVRHPHAHTNLVKRDVSDGVKQAGLEVRDHLHTHGCVIMWCGTRPAPCTLSIPQHPISALHPDLHHEQRNPEPCEACGGPRSSIILHSLCGSRVSCPAHPLHHHS